MPTRRLVAAGVLLACAAVVGAWLRTPPPRTPAASAATTGSTEVTPRAKLAPVAAISSPSNTPCTGPSLRVTADGTSGTSCAGAARLRRRGTLTTVNFALTGAVSGTLSIDVVHRAVNAVQLAGTAQFVCETSDCTGIWIQMSQAGAAIVSFVGTDLLSRATPAGVAHAAATLEGQLAFTIPPDATPCDRPSITLTRPDGGVDEFCPRGGAGFEVNDGGARTYQFLSLEGDAIVVLVDQSQTVRGVRLQSANPAACKLSGCLGVMLDGLSDERDRIVRFVNTPLLQPDSTSVVTVNGTLIVPSAD